jgi:hypothetical protein
MYFDEGRILKHVQQRGTSKTRNPIKSTTREADPPSSTKSEVGVSPTQECSSYEIKTANMLDSANNKLQELMQILYLLSRDPAVPNDARYHVTVAQGEIALLARVIRNKTEQCGEQLAGTGNLALRPAHP